VNAATERPIRIGFVTQIFPWVTQTFTYNEVVSWLRSGIDVEPIAFRKPNRMVLPGAEAEQLGVHRTRYIAEFGAALWLSGVLILLRHASIGASTLARVATRPYEKETTLRLRLTAVLAWVRALPIAALAKQRRYEIIHADFADQTATSAWIASRLTGIPFSFRSHGSFNTQLLDEKVRASAIVLCISEYDRRLLLQKSMTSMPEKLVVSYLGVDVNRWLPQTQQSDPSNHQILCVGTLQEKKGQRYLIEACEILQREGVEFRCTLIGDGPDREMLQRMIMAADLGTKVEITGYRTSEEVRTATLNAAIVCLPCVVARNGDEDGLPIVLMEGMAAAKACVSTTIAGISELIVHESSGLLVAERDAKALAGALRRLLDDHDLRRRLGEAARERAETHFDLARNGAAAASFLKQSLQS
jgi:glycosyltransferase involved in cell wall biosynthesis